MDKIARLKMIYQSLADLQEERLQPMLAFPDRDGELSAQSRGLSFLFHGSNLLLRGSEASEKRAP